MIRSKNHHDRIQHGILKIVYEYSLFPQEGYASDLLSDLPQIDTIANDTFFHDKFHSHSPLVKSFAISSSTFLLVHTFLSPTKSQLISSHSSARSVQKLAMDHRKNTICASNELKPKVKETVKPGILIFYIV